MKNKLTEQQRIDEVLSKMFSALIRKKMGKTVQDMVKKNPKIKKSVDNLNKGIDDFNDAFRKEYGDEFADKVKRDVQNLLK